MDDAELLTNTIDSKTSMPIDNRHAQKANSGDYYTFCENNWITFDRLFELSFDPHLAT